AGGIDELVLDEAERTRERVQHVEVLLALERVRELEEARDARPAGTHRRPLVADHPHALDDVEGPGKVAAEGRQLLRALQDAGEAAPRRVAVVPGPRGRRLDRDPLAHVAQEVALDAATGTRARAPELQDQGHGPAPALALGRLGDRAREEPLLLDDQGERA